jgi:hypothetical protein
MKDLEFALWRIVTQGAGRYGQLMIDDQKINRLKQLSAACEGWIYFDQENEETFIELADWLVRASQDR